MAFLIVVFKNGTEASSSDAFSVFSFDTLGNLPESETDDTDSTQNSPFVGGRLGNGRLGYENQPLAAYFRQGRKDLGAEFW